MKRPFSKENVILNVDRFNKGLKIHDKKLIEANKGFKIRDTNLIVADNFTIIADTPVSNFQTKQEENASTSCPKLHSTLLLSLVPIDSTVSSSRVPILPMIMKNFTTEKDSGPEELEIVQRVFSYHNRNQ